MRSSRRHAFGRIFRRTNREGFYIRVRYRGKEIERFAGLERRTAEAYLSTLMRQLQRETLLGEKVVAVVTFKEFKPTLLAALESRHAATTLVGHRARITRAIEHFGPMALRDIGPAEVQEFLTALRNPPPVATPKAAGGENPRQVRPLGIAATNRYLSFLSVAFKLAVQKGYAASNPVRDVPRPREQQRAVPFVSAADVDKLVAGARDPRFAGMIRVLADTGIRRSEALRLAWRDVDLQRRCILVRVSKNRRTREIALTANAHAALTVLSKERPATPIAGPALVWPEWTDALPTAVSSRFKTVADRAGFVGMRLHDLRHGFCSRLAQAGVPMPTIAALAGHESQLTTQRYACHLPETATKDAIAALQCAEHSAPAKKAEAR